MKRLLVIVAILGWALAGVGQAMTPSDVPQSTPASPGGQRVIVNGDWLYFDEYYDATGTITVTGAAGAVTLRKIPLGYALDVVWTPSSHTWVDAQVTKVERPGRTGFSDGGD